MNGNPEFLSQHPRAAIMLWPQLHSIHLYKYEDDDEDNEDDV